ncbi:hypothetical protein NBRC116602_04860 [Hyphomicrobiales bacterium 4NK60-0047b]|jgi:hypothetical protein
MLANLLKSKTNISIKLLSVMLTASISALIALSLIGFSTTDAEAKKYKRHYNNTIRIESRFSPNKYIIAPVRRNHYGDREVRLPNGHWINCAKNCRWTVQKEYLDFWEYQRRPFGPGYVRFERYFD